MKKKTDNLDAVLKTSRMVIVSVSIHRKRLELLQILVVEAGETHNTHFFQYSTISVKIALPKGVAEQAAYA
jgi:hypothetical protein